MNETTNMNGAAAPANNNYFTNGTAATADRSSAIPTMANNGYNVAALNNSVPANNNATANNIAATNTIAPAINNSATADDYSGYQMPPTPATGTVSGNGDQLDWNSVISKAPDRPLMPEGNYYFRVVKVEKNYFNGSEKLSPCNKASLQLAVDYNGQSCLLFKDLFLHKKFEGRLASFFISIGLMKGNDYAMDWDAALGKSGYAHVVEKTYTDKNGNIKKTNDIEDFIPAHEPAF